MKHAEYSTLVLERKACRLCSKLQNPSTILAGVLDSDEIGPYSRWQGSLNAELLVVAQDFADTETYVRLGGWPGERVSTNLTLTALLNEAGFPATPPRKGYPDDVVFLTNAVLCMKQGGMSAPVPRAYYQTCGREFLRSTIEIVRPRAVVALGAGALEAIRAAYGVPDRTSLGKLVDRTPAAQLSAQTALFAMFHPSPTVRNTVRSLAAQLEDWRRLGRWLRGSQPLADSCQA